MKKKIETQAVPWEDSYLITIDNKTYPFSISGFEKMISENIAESKMKWYDNLSELQKKYERNKFIEKFKKYDIILLEENLK